MAAADHRLNSLRAWTNTAAAPYQAKAAGCSSVSASAMPALVPVV